MRSTEGGLRRSAEEGLAVAVAEDDGVDVPTPEGVAGSELADAVAVAASVARAELLAVPLAGSREGVCVPHAGVRDSDSVAPRVGVAGGVGRSVTAELRETVAIALAEKDSDMSVRVAAAVGAAAALALSDPPSSVAEANAEGNSEGEASVEALSLCAPLAEEHSEGELAEDADGEPLDAAASVAAGGNVTVPDGPPVALAPAEPVALAE